MPHTNRPRPPPLPAADPKPLRRTSPFIDSTPARILSPPRRAPSRESQRRRSDGFLPFIILGLSSAPVYTGAVYPAAALSPRRSPSALTGRRGADAAAERASVDTALQVATTLRAGRPPLPEDLEENSGAAVFSWAQFMQQLPLQFMLPYSLPLYALLFSPAAALNAWALPNPGGWLLTPAMALFMALVDLSPGVTLAAWAFTSQANTGSPTLLLDAIHTLVALLTSRLAVCIKYAYLSPHDYTERMTTWLRTRESFESQLITGWLHITTAAICQEVGKGLRSDQFATADFEVSPATALRLMSGLDEEAGSVLKGALRPDEEAGSPVAGAPPRLLLSASDLVRALLVHSNNANAAYTTWGVRVMFLVAVVSTFSSTALRAFLNVPIFGFGAAEAVTIVGHWVANLFVMGLAFSLLFAAAVGHRRQQHALKHLGRLVSSADVSSAFSPRTEPVLALDSKKRLFAFLAAVAQMLKFGEQQNARLVTITSTYLAIYFAVCVYVLAALYQGKSGSRAQLNPPFLLLHALVLPAVAATLLMLREAARVNVEARRHTLRISATRLRLRLGAVADKGTFNANFVALEQQLVLLGDAERAMALQMELEPPLLVWGFVATDALFKAFAGTFVSIYTVSIGIYLTRFYGTFGMFANGT